MRRLFFYVCCLAAFFYCSACGGDSPTAPSVAQVSGVWLATVNLTSVSGGECVGATIAALGQPAQTFTVQISQTGSALTATATSTSTGVSTTYSGTAGANSIALNATSSSAANIFGFPCLSGALRDLQLQSEGVTATVNGASANGTASARYNVFIGGTSVAVGVLTLTDSFTMTRN